MTHEEILAECIDRLMMEDHRFTEWEEMFLWNLDELDDVSFPTDEQLAKLTEIWNERCK